ncbi:Uncharacterized protein PBTT_04409 [Plasmodiophora brassicae]
MSLKVLHVPDLAEALISVGKLGRSGYKILFTDGKATIFKADGWTPQRGSVASTARLGTDNLYRITQRNVNVQATNDSKSSRLGHIGQRRLQRLRKRSTGMHIIDVDTDNPHPGRCVPSLLTKETRASFPRSSSRATHR